MIDHLRALAVFAKTVELGSFRGAARALSLSPSVVSHHVAALERRLAVTLLYRSTRHLALTPDGEKVYAAAREMWSAAERGLDAASGSARAPRGVLRVTAPAMLAETPFCRDVAAFVSAYPNVQLTVGFTEQRRDLLRDGLDLALRIGRLADSTFKTRQLAKMQRVFVATPDYVSARPKPRAVGDLAAWDVIHLSALPPRQGFLRRGREATVTYAPRIAVDSATAMRAMALAGLGVASLPTLIARDDLARGRLVEVLPAWRLPVLGVYAVWPGGTSRPELTSRFVDFMAPRLATLFTEP